METALCQNHQPTLSNQTGIFLISWRFSQHRTELTPPFLKPFLGCCLLIKGNFYRIAHNLSGLFAGCTISTQTPNLYSPQDWPKPISFSPDDLNLFMVSNITCILITPKCISQVQTSPWNLRFICPTSYYSSPLEYLADISNRTCSK